jgi:hypothetical protein
MSAQFGKKRVELAGEFGGDPQAESRLWHAYVAKHHAPGDLIG